MRLTGVTIKDFFIGDTLNINWGFVLDLPYFRDMDKTEQNPRWHSEGSVLNHTKLVCEEMLKLLNSDECVNLLFHKKRLLMLSALFHDIGKPSTTELGKDGNWHSYGHDNVGSKLARRMLWDWDIFDREYIAHMVRYHMEPLHVHKQKNPEKGMLKLMSVLPYEELYLLKMADLNGAIQDPAFSTKEEDRQIVLDFRTKCSELWNAHSTAPFVNSLYRIPDFYMPMPFSYLGNEKVKTHAPTLHVMVGLPGSGKNSLIEELKAESIISSSAVILSRDDIRVELGYCSEEEKIVGTEEQEKEVTKVFNQRLTQAMREGKDIVVNNINLTEKRRKALKNQLPKYNYVYWYVEAPTLSDNLVRRYSQIDEPVFDNMLRNFEFPQTYECDLLYVYKQKTLTDDEEF